MACRSSPITADSTREVEYRTASSRRGWRIVRLIVIDDLAPGGEPDLLARTDMGERGVEVLAAMRMPDQERVETDRHHAAGLGAVLVEHIELVADHAAEILRTLLELEESRNVIDLGRIGQRDHRPRVDPHRIRLLVVHPVADVFDAVFGQEVERAMAL